jgi:uncharacterized ion transporter superfamily protein YfcC
MVWWIFVLVQKVSNTKKESYYYTEPKKDWTKFTTQKNENQKRKSSFFIATIMFFPLKPEI